MKGRRVPITGDPAITLEQPGDYCGPVHGYSGDKPAVFFLLPIEGGTGPLEGGMHHVVSPPHVFTEEPDGTLTIRESILSYAIEPDGSKLRPIWHGYLTRGEWVPC